MEKDSSPTKSEIEQVKAKTSYGSRVSEKLFRRKASTVKKEYHYIFGDYRNFMPEEAVLQRNRSVLYSKDDVLPRFLVENQFQQNIYTLVKRDYSSILCGKGQQFQVDS